MANTLSSLSRRETFNDLNFYFCKLETISFEKSKNKQIQVLVCKLENQALITYENLNTEFRLCYCSVKTNLFTICKATKSRITN